ncbi:MAG: hypothetical protein M1381_08750 [Deltaproteobacteria bacterium]|nr:hypothetical protein [Deltaproteobacteria bacterium]
MILQNIHSNAIFPTTTGSFGFSYLCECNLLSGSTACNGNSNGITVYGNIPSITMNYITTWVSPIQSIHLHLTLNITQTTGHIRYVDPLNCQYETLSVNYVGSVVADVYMTTTVIQPPSNLSVATLGLNFTHITVNVYRSHCSVTGNPTIDDAGPCPIIDDDIKSNVQDLLNGNRLLGISTSVGYFEVPFKEVLLYIFNDPFLVSNETYAPLYSTAQFTLQPTNLQAGQSTNLNITIENVSPRLESFYNPDYLFHVAGLNNFGNYSNPDVFPLIYPYNNYYGSIYNNYSSWNYSLTPYPSGSDQTSISLPITAPVSECTVSYPLLVALLYDDLPGDQSCPEMNFTMFTSTTINVTGTNPYSNSCCFVTAALRGTSLETNIPLIRSFRDRVLSKGYEGELLVALYYEYSPEITKIMLEHPQLIGQARELITQYLPIVKALLTNNGKLPPQLANKVFTRDEVNTIIYFIDFIHRYASPQLGEVLDYVKSLLMEYANLPLGLGIKTLIHGSPMPFNAHGKAIGIYDRLQLWVK